MRLFHCWLYCTCANCCNACCKKNIPCSVIAKVTLANFFVPPSLTLVFPSNKYASLLNLKALNPLLASGSMVKGLNSSNLQV